jgi:hypothetical protein
MTAMPMPSEEFEVLLSLATAWVEELEGDVLRRGIPLDQSQLSDARAVGVGHPERVRLLQVAQVPLPEHPLLLATCEATKAIGPRTWALSARYGILVRAERWGQREVVIHELVHTAQYQKLGSIRAFLQKYLRECLTVGYPQNPMEQEAITTAARLSGSSPGA